MGYTYDWIASAWSQCDAPCGEFAVKSRFVLCERKDDLGYVFQSQNFTFCSQNIGPQPANSELCGGVACRLTNASASVNLTANTTSLVNTSNSKAAGRGAEQVTDAIIMWVMIIYILLMLAVIFLVAELCLIRPYRRIQTEQLTAI